MNNKLIILTIALLKNSINFSPDKKKRNKQILLFAFIAVACIPMAISIVIFISDTYDTLVKVGEDGVLLSLGIAVSSFVIFFFGIFYSMNTFYFSEDVENLLPLPLKSSHILGAKFIIVTIYEYLTAALVLLPILVVFGIKSEGGFLFWVYSILIFISLPIIPIVLASLLVMVIMRFTNLAKNKDRFRVMSAVIGICFVFVFNYFVQKMATNQGQSQIQLGNNSLVEVTSNIFPTAKLGALGLINSGSFIGVAYIIALLALSIAGFYLFSFVGDMLYYRGVTGVSVVASGKKQLSAGQLSSQAVQRPVIKTYVLKELRILFRTPIYFINCILMNFLWPVFLLIPLLSQSKAMNGLGELAGLTQNPEVSAFVLVVAFGVALFVSSSNAITSTAISREGDNIFVNKYIPVSYKTQILSKVITGIIMSAFGIMMMIIASVILLKVPLYLIILVICVSFLGMLFTNFLGMIIDLLNPKLHWDNEQKAVKQNLNVVYIMLICVVFGALSIYLTFNFKLGLVETFAGIMIIFGILDFLLYKYLMGKGVEAFSKIEF